MTDTEAQGPDPVGSDLRPRPGSEAGLDGWRQLNLMGCQPGIAQVGVLVKDLKTSARMFSALTGLPTWSVYTYDSTLLRDMTYLGRRADFGMRVALSDTSPVVELIEPLKGPSIYDDWLQTHAEGLHHVAVEVGSIGDAIAEAVGAGIGVLQSGRGYGLEGDGGFAYLDTYQPVGVIVELLEIPKRRREPEASWNADSLFQ